MSRASSKRSRSWEVDVSLDELVEWEALEQFMHDVPNPESVASDGNRSCSGSQGDAGSSSTCGRPPSSSSISAPSCAAAPSSSTARLSAQTAVPASGPTGQHTIPLFDNFAAASAGMMDPGPGPSHLASGPTNHAAHSASSLTQALYGGWQQQSGGTLGNLPQMSSLPAVPMERGVSWGAELLPIVMDDGEDGLMDPSILDGADGAQGVFGIGDESAASKQNSMQKQRFVWTGELHRRFEAAVNTLGIDQAKPQAISQLMNCEGAGAPTRQNIKSHLQKYRLLVQKRQKQGGGKPSGAPREAASVPGPAAEGVATSTAGAAPFDADVHKELEQHLEKQEMNLKMQMDLQTKLHRQLLVQRQLQHQLEHCFPSNGDLDCGDRQRYQATVSLKNSLRERLTKHVMLQQEMLQHLDTLVSNEASKHEAAEQAAAAADE